MKIKTETVIVPEHSYEKTKYIADDGKEFSWSYDCIKYEEKLRRQSKKVNSTLVNKLNPNESCFEFINGCKVEFYYLNDVKDFHDLQEIKLCTFCLPEDEEGDFEYSVTHNPYRKYSDEYCDFYKYGPGWYMFYTEVENGGNWDNYCLNWNHYIEELENKVRKYKEVTEEVLAKASEKFLQQEEK